MKKTLLIPLASFRVAEDKKNPLYQKWQEVVANRKKELKIDASFAEEDEIFLQDK